MKNVKNKTARSLENVHTGDCLTNRLVLLRLVKCTCNSCCYCNAL